MNVNTLKELLQINISSTRNCSTGAFVSFCILTVQKQSQNAFFKVTEVFKDTNMKTAI